MRVVIAPATAVTTEIHECLKSWSGAGLLDPFCLWRVPLDGHIPDPRGVTRIDSGVDHPGTLAEVLQDTPSDQVSLLGLYAIAEGEKVDARFTARVDECLRLATNVLAYDRARPVECTVLVAPATLAQPVPAAAFCGSRNLYVAPEDRSAPRAPNQLPDSHGFLPRHAAHALATVADIWVDATTRPSGVLETVASEDIFAIDPPAVRMVRCFSRVIDFGYIADHVAAGVFQAGSEWPNPDPDHFDRVSEPTRIVKHAASEFAELHGEAIGLSEFEPLKLPAEKRPSLLEALRELVRLVVARIRRLPTDLADATVGSAHDRLADRIDRMRGPDAPRTLRWRERPETERNLTDIVDQLDRPISLPDGPTGALWRDLHRLSFALVDGSELPSGMDVSSFSQSGKRALVTKPTALVPDPEQKPPADAAPRACDPLALDPRFRDEPKENDEAEEADPERNAALEAWLEGRRSTLLWGIGYKIALALETARDAATELDGEAEALAEAPNEEAKDGTAAANEEEPDAPKRSRWRRLRNSLILYSGLALIASAVGWTQLEAVRAAAAQLLIGVGWGVAVASLALRFVRLERAIQRAEAERELAVVNTAMRRALHAGDQPRLERRYNEYLDWAEIIGWMAHRPWVGEAAERVAVRGSIPRSTLPAAFRVGVARIPEATIEQLSGQARAKAFQSGWLDAQYAAVAGGAMDRVALTYSYSGAGGAPDPDADTRDDPDSPRRQLLAAIRRGDGRSLRDNEMTHGVLRFIDRLSLGAATNEVRAPMMVQADANGSFRDHSLNPLPPCAAWFAPPADLPEISPRIFGSVIRIAVRSPQGPRVGLGVLLTPEGQAATSLSVVAGAEAIQVTLPDGSHRQATVAATLSEADLALLALEGDPIPQVEPLALGDSEPPLGDPVLAPGPPNGDVGSPALALGLITSQYGRQTTRLGGEVALVGATYRSAAGPAGSPVFDLNGKLLGIHGRTTDVSANGEPAGDHLVIHAAAIGALLAADSADQSEMEDSKAPGDLDLPKAATTDRQADAETITAEPLQFFSDLFPTVDGPIGLLPQHWVDPDDQHLTETAGEMPDLKSTDLHGLSTGTAFMQPLRILVHRVDMTPAVAARELVSVRAAERGDGELQR